MPVAKTPIAREASDASSRSKNDQLDSAGDTMHHVASVAAVRGREAAEHFVATPAKDIFAQLQKYAREKPDVAACWCFAAGIIVGWKLRS